MTSMTTLPQLLRVAALAFLILSANLAADPFIRLVSSDGQKLGGSVAVCGDYAVAGVGDDSAATNAYVFYRSVTGWVEQAILRKPETTNSGKFGYSVAMGPDYAVVGRREAEGNGPGRVYIYQRTGTEWALHTTLVQPKIVPEPSVWPYFGHCVAAQGDMIAVGAPYNSEYNPSFVYLYRRIGGVWQLEDQLSKTNNPGVSYLGWGVSLCGNTLATVGRLSWPMPSVEYAESVLIFQKSGASWSLVSRLTHLDDDRYGVQSLFGPQLVALTTNAVILGNANGTNGAGQTVGAAYLWNAPAAGWGALPFREEPDAKFPGLGNGPAFFLPVAIDGNIAVVGTPWGFGYAQVLIQDAMRAWRAYSTLRVLPWRDASYFGQSVALSGRRLIVGAPSDKEYFQDAPGAVYVFDPLSPAPAYGPTPPHDWGWAAYGECNPVLPANTTLAWTNGDTATSLDLYFNLGESPTNKVLDNVPLVASFDPGPLQPNRLYSWQVVGRNALGETAGLVWRFGTTGALDFAASPAGIPFGTLITNTISTPRVVSVQNPGPVNIWIEAKLTNSAFWMGMEANETPTSYDDQLSFYLHAGAQSNLVVVYVPTNVGHHADALRLLSYGTPAERRTNFVSLSGDGIAPTAGAPSNPSPPNGATGQQTDTDLSWQNGTGTTAVDLLFSKVSQPMAYLLSNATPATHFNLPRLTYNTPYQWQVVCRGGGGDTPGPVWTFTTWSPLIEVMSPNGREQWRAGTTHALQWKYKGDAETVRIDLYKLDAGGRRVYVSTLATNVPSDVGTYSWTIDPRLEPDDDYFIRVRDGNELNYSDYSDGPFAVTPTIVVTCPNGGEEVRAGAPCTITWLGAGLGGGVQVELWQNGSYHRRLDRLPNTGATVWNVPCDLEGRGFQICVFWLDDDALNDLSDGMFDVAILRPDEASHPGPADRTENVSLTPTLAWTNGAGTCTVDLFVGREDPPDEKVLSNVATNQFQLERLKPEMRLFWRVVSRNAAGTVESPVWSFTTMAEIQPPRLATPTRNGNHLEFQWTPYQAGVQYRFQGTTNLGVAFADVAVVQTNRYVHTNAAALPRRFYRVQSELKP